MRMNDNAKTTKKRKLQQVECLLNIIYFEFTLYEVRGLTQILQIELWLKG